MSHRPRGPRHYDDDITDSNLTEHTVNQVLEDHSGSRLEREYTQPHHWWGERAEPDRPPVQ